MTPPDDDPAAARRARDTLRGALGDLWDDDLGRVAHARTLTMLGLRDDALEALIGGGPSSAAEQMHLAWGAGDAEAAVRAGTQAIAAFPAHAVGFRNSVASLLFGLGRVDESLALLEANALAEPNNAAWPQLIAHVRAARPR